MDSFFSQFLGLIRSSFSQIYSLMERFTFLGTNLFIWILSLTILGVVLPIVLTLVRSSVSTSRSYSYRQERKERSSSNEEN